ARLAAPRLARQRLTPTTALGAQAVAARALFDASHDGSLAYFAPVAAMPGFPRALARTVDELALADVAPATLATLPGIGGDLRALFERVAEQFDSAAGIDRAGFLRTAALAAADEDGAYRRCRLLLLDVAVSSRAEQELIAALVAH